MGQLVNLYHYFYSYVFYLENSQVCYFTLQKWYPEYQINALALPIKFNLQIGANMVGNSQEHEVCINNKQIVNNHCCVVLNKEEIELIVLDGPVFYKNAEGDFEKLAKDSVLRY